MLIVDDNLSMRDALSGFLRSEGLDVVTADNGQDALEKLGLGVRPFVILLDLMMPVMDGYAFRRQQLRTPDLKDIQVIVFSASELDAGSVSDCFIGSELLVKPASPNDVLGVIRRARRATLRSTRGGG